MPSLKIEYDQEVLWDASDKDSSGFYACCGRILDCDADMDVRMWRRIGAANVQALDAFSIVVELDGLCSPQLSTSAS